MILPIALLAPQKATSFIVGDVRIQALSPHLVRIEKRGPKGFEDRETFHVQHREVGPEPQPSVQTEPDRVVIDTGGYVIVVANAAHSLSDVVVQDHRGNVLYRPSDEPVRDQFLPAPGKMPKVWAMSDFPRLVPPAWGATPAPNGEEGQGWDRGNAAPDLYLFFPDTYQTLRREFLRLTGPTEKPPIGAFGLIDSRYHAYTEKEALGVIDTYRRKRIPLDMFVVDTDWRPGGSDGYTVNEKYFPDMPRFLSEAHQRNVKVMFNDHPRPQEADALGTKEMTFRYEGLTKILAMGLDAWWFDRNWSVSLSEPMPGLHKEVWGQRLYHDMTLRFRPELRPLIMTNFQGIDNGRRHYAPQPAGHRYPIWWTGDTGSTFADLRRGVENGVDMGLLAVTPYVGEDLGGHTGQPNDELYVRFLQYGTLSPTTRLHCTAGDRIRYPWAFGPQAERIVTDFIRLRYRLMPTLYSAAQRAYDDGTPLLRRLDLEWPTYDEATRNDEYLLGDDLLVAPITTGIDPDATSFPAELLHTPDGQPGLQAEYFDNEKLQGTPTVRRVDPQVAFDWGQGSPDPKLPEDGFSARWTGKIGPMPATREYTLGTTSDDGVRLWVDGKLVIDKWVPLDSVRNVTKLRFEKGSTHDVRLEYYEGSGNAAITLGWVPPSDHPANLSERTAWIPPGEWRSLNDGQVVRGPRTITTTASLAQCPMWARVGGVITLGPEVQYTRERPWDALTLEAYVPSEDSAVRREIVEDDGETNAYAKGQVARTEFFFARRGDTVTIAFSPTTGSYRGALAQRSWRVRLNLPLNAKVEDVRVDGRSARFQVVDPVRSPQRIALPGGASPVAGTRVVLFDLPKGDIRRARKVEVRLAP